jgi:DNA replication licensing factor MCM7
MDPYYPIPCRGHIPRSMSVYARGELTRLASPGDEVTIDGIFLPQRVAESGYMAMKAGLISTTFLEAQNIIVHKKSFDEVDEEVIIFYCPSVTSSPRLLDYHS